MESPLKALLDQPLITRDQLASKLGISTDTVQGWTSDKRIPAFRLGHRTVRYSYPAVISALSRFYSPPEKTWSRKLPKRAIVPVSAKKQFQTELRLEESQLQFPYVF